ncbi:hypothetical protein M378DRAFT_157812 [Amanita muscaria Koide BX008]|uniref:Uncharacterized protein n=1 Tax=Amanita muscaria (strain Koide BX008) TaxID=946122 RepID=A0A0C2SYV3_AMAMK|nr:hypothetical protein M378DRAFT_157812 [Amanita muscaria Koide BX008]
MYQLETLASRRSRASQSTRTLKIANLGPCRDLTLLEQCVRFIVRKPSAADEVEAGMRKHLDPAISLLKNGNRHASHCISTSPDILTM